MTESPLHPYPDLDGLYAAFEKRSAALGAKVLEYGTSAEERPLRYALIGDPTRPVVSLSALIHGIEYIGGQVALGFLDALVQHEARFLDEACIVVTPCVNPDGYAACFANGGAGRVRDFRKNARRVDLNRNWPRRRVRPGIKLPFQGSDDVDAATYRGSAELSEPETRHLEALLREHQPHAALNLHSFMGSLIPPRCANRAEYRTYHALARAFFDAQPDARYRILASYWLDSYTGEQEDHQHGSHRTWACCVESFPLTHSFRQHLVAPSAFWRFNPKDPARYVENDVPGLFAYFRAALEQPRPGG